MAALTAAVTVVLYAFGEAMAPVYPAAKARAALLEAAAPRVEAVTLGSSHNNAIDFETLGTEGFHLWRSGGDLPEARHTLQAARRRLPTLRLVLLPVPDLLHDNASLGGPPTHIRYQTYAETGAYLPIAGDWRSFVHARAAPIARPDHWAGVLQALLGRRTSGVNLQADGWPSAAPRTTATLPPDTLLENAAARGRLHASMETTTLAAKPHACAVARGDLEAIVGTAGPAAVVFYTPPYHPAYSRWIEKASRCHLRTVADSLADLYPNVYYFAYDETAPFFQEAHLRDGDHLNLPGARAFSAELRRRLVEEGVL